MLIVTAAATLTVSQPASAASKSCFRMFVESGPETIHCTFTFGGNSAQVAGRYVTRSTICAINDPVDCVAPAARLEIVMTRKDTGRTVLRCSNAASPIGGCAKAKLVPDIAKGTLMLCAITIQPDDRMTGAARCG